MGVRSRADPADPLRDMIGIPRIAPLEDDLKSAKEGPGGPGILDLPSVHLDLNRQMPLDACDRVNNDATHLASPPSSCAFSAFSGGAFSLNRPLTAAPTAWAAIPTAVAAPATMPILSAPASTPVIPGILTPGSLS